MPRRSRKKNTPNLISAPPPHIQAVPENTWTRIIAEENETAERIKANMYNIVGGTDADKEIFKSFATMVNFNNYIRDQQSALDDYDKYKSFFENSTKFYKSVQYIRKLLEQRNVHFDVDHISDIVVDNPITFSNIEDFFRFCEKLVLPEEEEKKMIKLIDDVIDTNQKVQRDRQKEMNEVTKARIQANDMQSKGPSLIDDDYEFPKLGAKKPTIAWKSVNSTQGNKKPLQSRNMPINIQQAPLSAYQDFQKRKNQQKFKRQFYRLMKEHGKTEQEIDFAYSMVPDDKKEDTSEEAINKVVGDYRHLISSEALVYTLPSHGYTASTSFQHAPTYAAPACHALTYAAPVAYAGPHAMTYAAIAYADPHAMAYAAPVAYADPHGMTYAAPVAYADPHGMTYAAPAPATPRAVVLPPGASGQGVLIKHHYHTRARADVLAHGVKSGAQLHAEGVDFGRAVSHPYIFFWPPSRDPRPDYARTQKMSIQEEIVACFGKVEEGCVYIRVDPDATYTYSSEIRIKFHQSAIYRKNAFNSLKQQIENSKKTITRYLDVLNANQERHASANHGAAYYNLFSSEKQFFAHTPQYPWSANPIERNSEVLVDTEHLGPESFALVT